MAWRTARICAWRLTLLRAYTTYARAGVRQRRVPHTPLWRNAARMYIQRTCCAFRRNILHTRELKAWRRGRKKKKKKNNAHAYTQHAHWRIRTRRVACCTLRASISLGATFRWRWKKEEGRRRAGGRKETAGFCGVRAICFDARSAAPTLAHARALPTRAPRTTRLPAALSTYAHARALRAPLTLLHRCPTLPAARAYARCARAFHSVVVEDVAFSRDLVDVGVPLAAHAAHLHAARLIAARRRHLALLRRCLLFYHQRIKRAKHLSPSRNAHLVTAAQHAALCRAGTRCRCRATLPHYATRCRC